MRHLFKPEPSPQTAARERAAAPRGAPRKLRRAQPADRTAPRRRRRAARSTRRRSRPPLQLPATQTSPGAAAADRSRDAAGAPRRQNGSSQTRPWTGVGRIIAVGDVHGDYEQFTAVLASAGLIDGNGNWTGGKTHLVQTGDVVDRGPDSRAVMDLLMKLEKQAAAAGGAVHALIGNHEAMNVYGDLRYVSPGEFASYAQGPDASREFRSPIAPRCAKPPSRRLVRVSMQSDHPRLRRAPRRLRARRRLRPLDPLP